MRPAALALTSLLAAATLGLGASVAAEDPQRPVWIQLPTGDQIDLAYRGICFRTRVPTPGTAVMDCRVVADGHIDDCKLISEEPAHCEYGAAILRLAPDFRTSGLRANGRPIPVGTRIRLPFRFELPKD